MRTREASSADLRTDGANEVSPNPREVSSFTNSSAQRFLKCLTYRILSVCFLLSFRVLMRNQDILVLQNSGILPQNTCQSVVDIIRR